MGEYNVYSNFSEYTSFFWICNTVFKFSFSNIQLYYIHISNSTIVSYYSISSATVKPGNQWIKRIEDFPNVFS